MEHGYDLKHLIRTVLNSRVYQESSTPNETNLSDTRNFSRSYRRRLPAEVMLDAVCDVTGVPEKLDGLPPGARAVRAWNYKLDSTFLDAFGRPNSSADCPCERDRGASLVQALHLMNSAKLQAKVADPAGRAARRGWRSPTGRRNRSCGNCTSPATRGRRTRRSRRSRAGVRRAGRDAAVGDGRRDVGAGELGGVRVQPLTCAWAIVWWVAVAVVMVVGIVMLRYSEASVLQALTARAGRMLRSTSA